jgi:hypothetical protein
MKKLGCDISPEHAGPFFSVNVIAYQVGEGVFPKGAKRVLRRYHVGRRCMACLRLRGEHVPLKPLAGARATDPVADC